MYKKIFYTCIVPWVIEMRCYIIVSEDTLIHQKEETEETKSS